MENTTTSTSKQEKTRVIHITSIGLTARTFLPEHFRLLHNAGFEAILVCSDDEDARYCNQATGARFIPVTIKQNIAPVSDLISLFRLWRLFRRLRLHGCIVGIDPHLYIL